MSTHPKLPPSKVIGSEQGFRIYAQLKDFEGRPDILDRIQAPEDGILCRDAITPRVVPIPPVLEHRQDDVKLP